MLGEKRGVPLPWALLAGLPGFEHVITARFGLFTAGLIGAALAFALDDALDLEPMIRAAGLAVVAVALVPLVPVPLPGADNPPVPAFFTGRAARDLTCPGGSLLVLPFPRSGTTEPMAWQQAAGMSFAMPGGYFIGPGPGGRAAVHGEASRAGLLFRDVLTDGVFRPVTPQLRQDFDADVGRWRACAAVLGPTPNAEALRAQATALIGREPEPVEGVLLWRDLAPPGRAAPG